MSQYGKDKDDNVVTLQEVLENSDRNVEEIVDIKMKVIFLRCLLKNLKCLIMKS